MFLFKRKARRSVSEQQRDLASKRTLAVLGLLLFLATAPLYQEMPVSIAVFFTGLFLAHFARLRFEWIPVNKITSTIASIVTVGLVFREYHTIVGYEAGIQLFGLLLAGKLLESRYQRDLYIVVIIGLFFIVTRFLLNQSMYWAFYSLLVVICFFSLLYAENGGPRHPLAAIRFVMRLMVQAIPVAVVLFLLFPRLDSPLWHVKLGTNAGVTGLSERMAPGSINQLIQSDEPAFRVEFQGQIPEKKHLYWRGPVLWSTNGLWWYRDSPYIDDSPQPVLDRKSDEYRYRVILEPHGKRWVLPLDLPVAMPGQIRMTPDFQLLNDRPIHQKKQFELTSVVAFNTGNILEQERTAAMQLPNRIGERTRRLAEDLKAGSNTDQEFVSAVFRHFNQEEFVYTLKPPLLRSTDRTEEFLFETKAGFCEHYASAFTILMRLGGVPARVVTGYLGGEYNELGNYLLVRQSDAHAWSEVWLAEKGWVRIDPTEAVAPERIEQEIDIQSGKEGEPVSYRFPESGWIGSSLRTLRWSLDALNTKWHLWVLGYDDEKQSSLMHNLGLGGLNRYATGVLIVSVVAIILVVWLAILGKRTRQPVDPLTRQYSRFCEKLQKIGLKRGETEGPLDFSQRVAATRADLRGNVEAITTLYCKMKYGNLYSQKLLTALEVRVTRFKPKRRQ